MLIRLLTLLALASLNVTSLIAFPSANPDIKASGLYRNTRTNPDYFQRAHPEDKLSFLYYGKTPSEMSPSDINQLQQAAVSGNVDAQFRLAWMNESGPYQNQDPKKAIQYYTVAAEQGHAAALNNLAILLIKNGENLDHSADFNLTLKSAAAKGNLYALNRLGLSHVRQTCPEPRQRAGLDMILQSSQAGHYAATRNLIEIVKEPASQALFTEAELKQWSQKQLNLKQLAQAGAQYAINKARPFIDEQDYDTAISIINQCYLQYREQEKIDIYSFLSKIWQEAQTQGGQTDPEWGWRLFKWAVPQYDLYRYAQASQRLMVRKNTAAVLTQVGRIGLLRQVCDEIRDRLLEIYGIEISQEVVEGMEATEELPESIHFPHKISHEMKQRSSWNLRPGSWLTNSTMESMLSLCEERLYAGDWKEALYLSHWVEQWAIQILQETTLPQRENRSWIEETRQGALMQRAQIMELLGNAEAAIAIYTSIRLDGETPYKGRKTDRATMREAALRARRGDVETITISALAAMEPKQRANAFDSNQAGEENKLTRAAQYYSQGDIRKGDALLQSVLQYTEVNQRPFLRLKARITEIEFSLSRHSTAGLEEALLEALKLCQSKGFKNLEPKLYELYSSYLLQSGSLQAALDIQLRAIELTKALKLDPKLPAANQRLAHINTLLSEQNAETYAQLNMSNNKAHEQHVEAEIPLQRTIDLQPLSITTAPIPGKTAKAIFSVSNLRALQTTVQLSMSGQATFKAADTSGTPYIYLSAADEGEINTMVLDLSLTAMQQTLIHISIAPELIQKVVQTLNISVRSEQHADQSKLIILKEPGVASSAVIEAIEINDNPFYLISAFHHLSNARLESTKKISLRAIASQPTRIEAYDEEGLLLFIDAEGNGSFSDPGDLLLTPITSESFPVLDLGASDRQIEYRYQPHKDTDPSTIEIEIQRLDHSTPETWETDAIDMVRYKNQQSRR